MTLPSVDVVIVTYNSASFLDACLDAIADQAADGVQVIVVDNDSHDDTLDVARNHRVAATVLESGGNLGYSGAINIGVAAAKADAVLILNPDTAMRAGSLQALHAALVAGPAGIVAPTILNADGGQEFTIRRFPSTSRLLGQTLLGSHRVGGSERWGDLVTTESAYHTAGEHDWCSGAVLLIGRACLEAVGRWDESFFLYSEETDFCWRANQLGYRTVFVPEAVVEHIGGESGTSARLWSMLVTNRVKVVRKHRGVLHGATYWAVSVLGELMRSFRPRNRAALQALVTNRKDPAVVEATEREARLAAAD